jgi:hypothetical protein
VDDQVRVAAVEMDHPLLDVLTHDEHCPVCGYRGTPISDDRGVAYRHEFRHYLCRVTPKLLEGPWLHGERVPR